MYHGSGYGGSADFWEGEWDDGGFDEALRFCDVDPLRPLFERYAPAGSWLLEGGCGRGQYVAYLSERGVRAVGLDFEPRALERLRARRPRLMLCAGDVAALPFRDQTFDAYYSGGVVEHFEAGPERALSECRRVLKPTGTLLISVPYHSPLRSAVVPFRNGAVRRVARTEVDRTPTAGMEFWQYAFTAGEFEKLLNDAGLRVVGTQGYAVTWGLHDVPFFTRFKDALDKRRSNGASVNASPTATSAATRARRAANDAPSSSTSSSSSPHSSTLKRLVISEDTSVPVAGLFVRALRWACGNMMMYVCVRDDAGDERKYF